MHCIPSGPAHPLHTVEATHRIEQAAMASLPPHTLMQRAGLAVARLTLALAPHAQRIWVACGPGNNGGDGLEAAIHLKQWGKDVVITWLGNAASAPADAKATLEWARAANMTFVNEPPDAINSPCDFAIDALLGIGASRSPEGRLAEHIAHLKALAAQGVPVLAVDVPSGLNADTGQPHSDGQGLCVQATHTLTLLTLKPGLYTAQGRDAAGDIWFDDLGVDVQGLGDTPTARLNPAPSKALRTHASHKGSYGDVAVIGGARGMAGAALLAARAALHGADEHGGAGRVYVGLLDESLGLLDATQPELMLRSTEQLLTSLGTMTVVCGCGGGNMTEGAIAPVLPRVLAVAPRLVLDADALNAIAADAQLQAALAGRQGLATVLTPHPLEAARLLGITTDEVQRNRLAAAQTLALRFGCVVALKGSGTVIAAPDETPRINPTGNGRLATAGTGDVLAGFIGAKLANQGNDSLAPFEAACAAVYLHGLAADEWPASRPLTAGALAQGLSV